MKNKELIEKRFDQIEYKMKYLKYALSNHSEQDKKEYETLYSTINDLKILIYRDLPPSF